MSDVPAPQRPQYDFLKPLTFVFEDPQWIPKILLGGLFTLASVFLIGVFFVYGYAARLVRNVIAGVERPLPEWTDLGDMFSEGVMLFVAGFLYMIPLFGLFFFMVPFSVLTNIDNAGAQILGGGAMFMLALLIMPLGFVLSLWIPAALLQAIVRRDFRAAFDFRTIWDFIRNNAVNYVLAYLDWFVARFAVGFGIFLCCVGLFVTAFWSMTVGAYAFGQCYRMSENR